MPISPSVVRATTISASPDQRRRSADTSSTCMVAMGREDTGDPAYDEKRGTPCAAAPSVAAMLRPDDREPGPHDLVDDAGATVARVDIADRIDWLQADV